MIPTMSFREARKRAEWSRTLCAAWRWSNVPPSATTGYARSTSLGSREDDGLSELKMFEGCSDGGQGMLMGRVVVWGYGRSLKPACVS